MIENGVYLILGIAFAILIAIGLRYLSREVLNPKGRGASRKTARILSKFAILRGFKVLSGVSVNDDAGDLVIENMLIGYFGILLVRTLGARGEYFGTLGDDKWSVVIKGEKTFIENPVKRLAREAAALRGLFSKKKLYNIPIETVVSIPSKSKKTAVYITHSGEILLGGKLGAYLGKTKFEKDVGLDVKKLADAVLQR